MCMCFYMCGSRAVGETRAFAPNSVRLNAPTVQDVADNALDSDVLVMRPLRTYAPLEVHLAYLRGVIVDEELRRANVLQDTCHGACDTHMLATPLLRVARVPMRVEVGQDLRGLAVARDL